MAFRPPASSRGWIHPAGVEPWHRLADAYGQMGERSEEVAARVAHEHIVKPMRRAGVPEAQVFRDGDDLCVGVPDDHPNAAEAADREFGTLTRPAGGQIRHVLRTHRAAEAFERGLVE